MTIGRPNDQGVTLVEFSLVFGLLLMIALGAFEYGMVFRDSLTVSTASREAGRVAASTANFGDADCVILEAAVGTLRSIESGSITMVHIYKSDDAGTFPPPGGDSYLRSYSPRIAQDDADMLPLQICATSNWTIRSPGPAWDPSLRVNTEGEADWIGVRIDYDHRWITGFLWWDGTLALADDAVFRIEPPTP